MACLDIGMMHFLEGGGGRAHICCETNTSFLGKGLPKVAMMDEALVINVTSQIVVLASWKKMEVSNVLDCLKERSGSSKVIHSKNKH